MPRGLQPVGDGERVADGEAVDDARARDRLQPLGQPHESFGLGGQVDDAEPEAGAAERSAERRELGTELLGHVVDHPRVRRGRASEDRHLGDGRATVLVDHPPDASVVGAEVVTPVRDAVHLVDDHHPGLRFEHRHHLRGELGVRQTLG